MTKLLDILIETKIFEMAYSRKVSMDKTRDLSLNTSRELLKILMYPTSKNQPHWQGKLNGWLRDIKRYTTNTLKERDLVKLLWKEPLGEIYQLEDLIQDIETDYYKPSYHIDYSDLSLLNQKIERIFRQISNDMVNNKVINVNNYI